MTGPTAVGLRDATVALLQAHHGPAPLVLPNAWDVASARAVEAAGFPVVATSSRAIASVTGRADDDSAEPDAVFAYHANLARSVSVPVTADLEAGYRLAPDELVDRMLGAGLAGCNLEDSDHHGTGPLVECERQVDFLSAVRRAGDEAGVHLVINARVDAVIRRVGSEEEQLDEAISRARRYLAAGADCVYPIALADPARVRRFVTEVGGPVNIVCRTGRPGLEELARLGVRRISFASGIFQLLAVHLDGLLADLAGAPVAGPPAR